MQNQISRYLVQRGTCFIDDSFFRGGDNIRHIDFKNGLRLIDLDVKIDNLLRNRNQWTTVAAYKEC